MFTSAEKPVESMSSNGHHNQPNSNSNGGIEKKPSSDSLHPGNNHIIISIVLLYHYHIHLIDTL